MVTPQHNVASISDLPLSDTPIESNARMCPPTQILGICLEIGVTTSLADTLRAARQIARTKVNGPKRTDWEMVESLARRRKAARLV